MAAPKLADKLKSKISIQDHTMEVLYQRYVELTVEDTLTAIERNANPDKRNYISEEFNFLTTHGDVTCFTDFSGSLWGRGMDVIAEVLKEQLSLIPEIKNWTGRRGGHFNIKDSKQRDHLAAKASALRTFLTGRKNQLLEDVRAGLCKEGFNVAAKYVPERNFRYDNGIGGYNLVIEVNWD